MNKPTHLAPVAALALLAACGSALDGSGEDPPDATSNAPMCSLGQRYVDGKCVFADSLFVILSEWASGPSAVDQFLGCAVTGGSLYYTHSAEEGGCYFSPADVTQVPSVLAAGELHLQTAAGEQDLVPDGGTCFAPPEGDFIRAGGAVHLATTGGASFAPVSIDDTIPENPAPTIAPAEFTPGQPFTVTWKPSATGDMRVFVQGGNGFIDCTLPDTGSYTISPRLTGMIDARYATHTAIFRNKRIHVEAAGWKSVFDASLRSGSQFDTLAPPTCTANGQTGACIATSQCKGTPVAGYCPGTPTDIQCCI